MKLFLSSVKLAGNPDVNGRVQVYDYVPKDDKYLSKGQIFACMSLKFNGMESEGQMVLGKEVISRLHEEYFGNSHTSIFEDLKIAVDKLCHEFENLGLEIAVAVVFENKIYVAASGGAEVSILRNGTLARILASTTDEVASASGIAQNGDYLLLATKKFVQVSGEGLIKAALESGNLNSVLEFFAPIIHSRPDASQIGAVFVNLTKDLIQDAEVAQKKKFPRFKLPDFLNRFSTTITTEGDDKRLALTVGIILLILLLVSMVFGVRKKLDKDTRAQYEPVLIEAKNNLEESLNVYGQNPSRARELYLSSDEKVKKLTDDGVKDSELSVLKAKIDENRGQILGEYRLEPNLFLDLGLLSSNFNGTKMNVSEKSMFILDGTSKKLAQVMIDSRKAEIIAGPDVIAGFGGIVGYVDDVYLIGDTGIKKANGPLMLEKDWQGEIITQAYSGNIYILEKSNSKIYRYTISNDRIGPKQPWLAPGININLNDSRAMTIDGAIWVLTSPIRVSKFLQGAPKEFVLEKISPELENIIDICTNEDQKYLYLLEPDKERIVVFDKNGKFKAQYISDKLKGAINIAVSEELKRMVFLTGDKLYSLEIKHP